MAITRSSVDSSFGLDAHRFVRFRGVGLRVNARRVAGRLRAIDSSRRGLWLDHPVDLERASDRARRERV